MLFLNKCRLHHVTTVKPCRWHLQFNKCLQEILPSSIMIGLIITIEIEEMINTPEEVAITVTLVTIIGTEILGIVEITEETNVVVAMTVMTEGDVGVIVVITAAATIVALQQDLVTQ